MTSVDTRSSDMEMLNQDPSSQKSKYETNTCDLWRGPLLVMGFGICIVTILVIALVLSGGKVSSSRTNAILEDGCNNSSSANASSVSSNNSSSTNASSVSSDDYCTYSIESEQYKLKDFLEEMRTAYKDFTPYASDDPYKYQPYNPHPLYIKQRTDKAKELLAKLNGFKFQMSKLKTREKKAILQTRHFLESVFGTPYDGDYYAGDWLLGPNTFCWMPICDVEWYTTYIISSFEPSSYEDMQLILDILRKHNDTFAQYEANMKDGVKAGMVRSKVDCTASYFGIAGANFPMVAQEGKDGILNGSFGEMIFEKIQKMNESLKMIWKDTHGGIDYDTSVKKILTEYIGVPLHSLIMYIKNEHVLHCPPSSVAAGLANLPLSHVYYNGSATSEPTTGVIPGTNIQLNGMEIYQTHTLPYFTTNDMTANEVHDLGIKMRDYLYPQAVRIAKQISGLSNEAAAIIAFKTRLNASDQWFNVVPIPANESDENAWALCKDIDSARIHCPVRWFAMKKAFDFSLLTMANNDAKSQPFFWFNGPKRSTPNCPILMSANFNPAAGAESYRNSNYLCSRPAKYNIPFWKDRMGPIFSSVSVAVHEGRPGHHTQVQGFTENFGDSCGGVPKWIDDVTYYTAFTEGWALYSESLMAEDTDIYADDLFQKFGFLKWQIWRALRLIVDTGLHYKSWTRDMALEQFATYAWDDTDMAEREVTRYQSNGGQATSYMIGQLRIIDGKDKSKNELGEQFNVRDFHYQVLSQGSSPLQFLTEHIDFWIDCVKEPAGIGCNDIKPKEETSTIHRESVYHGPIRNNPF